MNWPSLEAFWQMGGYGLFVWGAYAATFGALALEAWLVRRRFRRASRAAAALKGRR